MQNESTIVVDERTSLLNNDEDSRNYNTIEHQYVVCGGYENNNSSKNKLIKVLCVSSLFFLIELTGGLISGSLALLSDSFHLLSGKYITFVNVII